MGRSGEKTATAIQNSVGRAAFVALALILQLGYLVYLISRAGEYYPYITLAMEFLALSAVIAIYSQGRSAASKAGWIVLILCFPILGLCLYLLLGQSWATRSIRRRFERANHAERLPQDADALRSAEADSPGMAGQMRYILNWAGYPVYRNTAVEFHSQSEIAFSALKRELRRAERFIFMEYHAIELSDCFLELEAILAERAAAGVEVRLFYDDVGSIGFIGPNFVRRMAERGVHCRVFNPLVPTLRPFMNNRDHRKITVIDGRIGFTGGYNLADEYFNVKHPYGHWKDAGLMLRGDAVRSLTAMFLEMWNAAAPQADDSLERFDTPAGEFAADGWVQPYADSPLDEERVGENVYLNLIEGARRYVWITTPYLILDDELLHELILAAKRGVDVRVVTPGIPDKKLVYQLTRSCCAQLARGGVRVYEYAPGFLHAKLMLVDDLSASVGTANLDYRSLYLHFENGVLLHKCAAIADIRRDFDSTLSLCRETTALYLGRRPTRARVAQGLLRLIAPLL